MVGARLRAVMAAVALLFACGADDDVTSNADTTTAPTTSSSMATTSTLVSGPRVMADDVAYAPLSEAQRLDVYTPSSGGPFPLVMFIHGGGWSVGDKRAEYAAAVVPLLVGEGYAVASVNYRLSAEATFPAQLLDVKAAVRWLRANARAMNVEGDLIAATGESAGGHLAALLGTTSDVPELDDPELGNPGVSSAVQAVVDFYGPVDLLAAPEQLDGSAFCMANGRVRGELDPAIEGLLGSPAAAAPALATSANPMSYVDAGDELPPFFIAHGDQDCVVPYQGSVDLDAALRAAGGTSTLVLVAGSGHYTAFDAASQVPNLLAFLDRTIGA